MGHGSGKNVWRALGRKLDSLQTRAPYNETLRAILQELYTPGEAEVVAKMPSTLVTLERLVSITGMPSARLEAILEGLCNKGLVIDLWFERAGQRYYAISPYVVGVYEFTMMRTGSDAEHRRRARLFADYWHSFLEANFGDGQQVAMTRALPHEDAVAASEPVEILDYERASAIVAEADRFAVGTCSCRHEKHHLGQKRCDVPLESCTVLGRGADYLIRRGLAREISRERMLELVERSRELGLVMNAENVQRNTGFICHCCACCCNLIGGITEFGYSGIVVSSSLAAEVDLERCRGCGQCVDRCPFRAIVLDSNTSALERRHGAARVDEQVCLGCGVCVPCCARHALRLVARPSRVFHPETTFERVLLMALERGTLQALVFDHPQGFTEEFLRGFLGGFLRLTPVKRALVGERFRSLFLGAMRRAARGHASSGPASEL